MTDPNAAVIQQVATNYNLPVDLLTGQVQVESSGDPNAIRYEHDFFTRYILGNAAAKAAAYGPLAACSYGLLQIMLETAYELGFTGRPEQLFVDRVGLAWGAAFMQKLLGEAGGNYRTALEAYNGGPSLVHRTEASEPAVVRNYADAVYKAAGRTV